MEALEALGDHAKEHGGALAARLEHEDGDVRAGAVDAPGALGEHAKEHAGALTMQKSKRLKKNNFHPNGHLVLKIS